MWVKLDDAILDHPKISAIGTTGFALYVAGIVFCGRNLSNGFIPKERALLLLPLDADDLRESRTVSALISHGLWSACDGGYMVHDYLKYNPSRARVLRDRARARQRMKEVRANFERTSSEVLGARTRTRTQEVQEEPSTTTFAVNGQKRPLPAVRFDTDHFVVPENLTVLWEQAYPAVNVRVEIAAAAAWAVANPRNHKSNWARFLVGWLKKAQDSAPARGTSTAQSNPPKRKEYTAEELAWANRLLSREGR